MAFQRRATHPKYKDVFFPIAMGYSEEEWDQKVSDYLKKDEMSGETIVNVKYNDEGTDVTFWTENYVVNITSIYE